MTDSPSRAWSDTPPTGWRKYQKRPLVIHAIKLTTESVDDVLAACGAGVVQAHPLTGVMIRTLEGNMLADPGDYIIRGIKGEFYPCKPDIFEASYDESLSATASLREELREWLSEQAIISRKLEASEGQSRNEKLEAFNQGKAKAYEATLAQLDSMEART